MISPELGDPAHTDRAASPGLCQRPRHKRRTVTGHQCRHLPMLRVPQVDHVESPGPAMRTTVYHLTLVKQFRYRFKTYQTHRQKLP